MTRECPAGLWPFALLWLLIAGCGTSDLLGPDAAQGIEGTVLLGPQCPVQTQDDPCPDLPYQAWIGIRDYVLQPESGDPFPTASDQEVTVVMDVFAEVVIHFDTGIR
ncbi:MAG: hypothetical protein P8170_25200 [Gemmatimonadota bacterium]